MFTTSSRLVCMLAVLGVAPFWIAETSHAAPVTYIYDELGRVTFVIDPVNGNRDYDYDAAGNRLLVSVGAAADSANDPSTAAPSRPSALSFPSSSTTGNYAVNWGAAAGNVTRYELWQATSSSFSSQTRIYNGTALGYSVSGRGNGTYYYRVRACNGSSTCGQYRQGSNSITVLLPPSTPGTMTIPSVAIPGNSYSISWVAAGGSVTRYELQQHSSSSFNALVASWNPTTTSISIAAATQGTFYFRVRACNTSGCSSYRNGSNSIAIMNPPAAPSGLSATLVSYCTWRASWTAVTGASSYLVTDSVGTTYNIPSPSTAASIVWASPCPPPAGASPNDRMPRYVRACNIAGCSTDSSFSTQAPTPPQPPASISYPSSSSTGSFTVSWSSSPDIASTYQLEQATNSSFSGASLVHESAGTSIGLSRGNGTYYYRVRACNGTSCGSYRTGGALTVTLPPGAPGGMSIPSSGIRNTNYTISWGAASGTIARYDVEQHSNSSFSALVSSWTPTTNSLSVAAPSTGTFYFRVRACNASGCSGYQNGANGITIAGPPAAPTGLSATLVSYCTWRASWTAATNAAHYIVTDTLGSTYNIPSPSTSASIVWASPCPPPAGASPEDRKPRYVRACNSAGCSTDASFSVSASPPQPPASITYPSTSSNGSFTVSWGSSPDVATTYQLEQTTNSSFSGASLIHESAGSSVSLSRGDGTYYYRVRACNGASCGSYRAGGALVVTLPPGTPGAMSIPSSGIRNTNYTIGWGAASGTITRYEVEQHSNSGFTALVNSWSPTSTSLSVAAPSDGTFFFRVRACNVTGCSGYQNGANGINVLGPPAVPTGLSATLVSYCTWRALWSEVTSATSYVVTDTLGATYNVPSPSTYASIVWASPCPPPAGASPEDRKPRYVRACNSAGCSADASFSASASAPQPPTSISYPSSSSNGSFTVSWSSSPDVATTYQLEQATNSSFSGASLIHESAGSSVNLSRGDGTYYYRVRACNGASCGSYRTGGALTVLLPPGVPPVMSIPATGSLNATYSIGWSAGSGTVSHYEVEQHANSSYSSLIASWSPTSTSLSVSAPTTGTFYFRVRACNSTGCSGYQNGANGITISAATPQPPTGLSATQVSYCTWRATWNASSGATSYRVTDSQGVVHTTTGLFIGFQWSTTCPPPSGVNPYNKRPVYLQACNAAGCSSSATFP
jgi:hypothetical protein